MRIQIKVENVKRSAWRVERKTHALTSYAQLATLYEWVSFLLTKNLIQNQNSRLIKH